MTRLIPLLLILAGCGPNNFTPESQACRQYRDTRDVWLNTKVTTKDELQKQIEALLGPTSSGCQSINAPAMRKLLLDITELGK